MERWKNYAAVTLLCAVVLLLFQLIGMSLGLFDSEYEINQYAREEPAAGVPAPVAQDDVIALVTGADGAAPAVADACAYLRRGFLQTEALDDDALSARVLVWASKTLSLTDDLPRLLAYSQAGGTLIFAELPELSLIRHSAELRALLGVEALRQERMQTMGTWLYDGFLLGGEKIYTELRPTVPWFRLLPGYSVYLSGMFTSDPADESEGAPLLWRAHTYEGFVFVLCQNHLARRDGVGFLYAMLAKAEQPLCYPVVNAQTMMVQNFPYLSSENDDVMRQSYRQTSNRLFFNALLPNVTAVFSLRGYPLNCFFNGALDSAVSDGQLEWNRLRHYIRLIIGRSGEMGVSGYDRSADGTASVLRNLEGLAKRARAYSVTVFSPDGMDEGDYLPLLADGAALSDIQTVVLPMREGDVQAVSFLNDRVLQLPVTHDGYVNTDERDLALRSLETALLCSNVSVDMSRVLYPTGEDDDWALLNKSWSDALAGSWKPFEKLDRLILSDADRRARAFLSAPYTCTREGDRLTLWVESGDAPMYFLLRGEDLAVKDCAGATATRLENGVYLIAASGGEATLTLENEHRIGFTE